MPKIKLNNVEIEYKTFGNPTSKPLLLIAGIRIMVGIYHGFPRENVPKIVDAVVENTRRHENMPFRRRE